MKNKKVSIKVRRVYHLINEAIVDVPKNINIDDVSTYINDNWDKLKVDDLIDEAHSKNTLEGGLGLGDGMEDTFEESEWRYDELDSKGHPCGGGHL